MGVVFSPSFGYPKSRLTTYALPITLILIPGKSFPENPKKMKISASRDVVRQIEQLLSVKKYRDPKRVLDEVIGLLHKERRYFWIGLYLIVGNKAVRVAFRGLTPPCHEFELGKGNVGTAGETGVVKVVPDVTKDATYSQCFIETKSEIVVPIKIAQRVLGVMDVESDRPDAFRYKDQAILKRTAKLLATYIAPRNNALTRKLKPAARPSAAEAPAEKLQPESERASAERSSLPRKAAGATARV